MLILISYFRLFFSIWLNAHIQLHSSKIYTLKKLRNSKTLLHMQRQTLAIVLVNISRKQEIVKKNYSKTNVLRMYLVVALGMQRFLTS